MRPFQTLLIAGSLVAVASAASASTVTQLIHFDEVEAQAPQDPYFTPDNNFQLDVTEPENDSVNFSASSNCADPIDGENGNGSCVVEMDQGTIWTLTHDADQSGVSENYVDEFDLLGFYFHLQGGSNQNPENNFISISTTDAETLTWAFGDAMNTGLITREDGEEIDTEIDVDNNTGYFVDLSSLDDWKNITFVDFTNGPAGNTRLDCIVVSFDGTTTQPYDGSLGGCGLGSTPDPIPLPAAGWLLLGGLGGLVAMKRRKS